MSAFRHQKQAAAADLDLLPPDRARRRIEPQQRMGRPEDVANAVSFFCEPRASFVTGQTLFVCGGVTVG